MVSRFPSFDALKKSIKEQPSAEEVYQLLTDMLTETDRAAAIVLGTIVESGLEDAVLSRLIPLSKNDYASLFEGDSPLGNFSSKIKMGFALQIYGSNTRAELNRVRDIRNAFAHARKSLSFGTPEVAHYINLMEFHTKAPEQDMEVMPPVDTPRKKFLVNCVLLWSQLRVEKRREGITLLKYPPHMD